MSTDTVSKVTLTFIRALIIKRVGMLGERRRSDTMCLPVLWMVANYPS